MKKISSHGFKLAVIGAALAVSGAVVAADGISSKRTADRAGHAHHAGCLQGHAGSHSFHKSGHHGGFHHGMSKHGRHAHMERAGLIVPGYGVVSRDFVDGMGLNDKQLALVEDARKAAKDFREGQRARMREGREGKLDRFSSALDPEQALKQRAEKRAAFQQERDKIDQKWVAVWQSLDSTQQARIGEHLKQRAEKAQKRIEARKERREQREQARAQRSERQAAVETAGA